MNKVILSGNIVKDIELMTTSNDISFARFTIAVKRNEEKTDFINCIAWRKIAETMSKYCKKGDKVAVVGKMEVTKYEAGGEKRTMTEINVDEVEFLSQKKPEQSRAELKEIQDDNLPF